MTKHIREAPNSESDHNKQIKNNLEGTQMMIKRKCQKIIISIIKDVRAHVKQVQDVIKKECSENKKSLSCIAQIKSLMESLEDKVED